ncbi:hypothetical protein [Citrobacter braakii]|uniref:hypothetical protein n=1 Tax=Citrobacter braakii TaxID=57706 RepID=UPI003D730124
MQLNPKTFVRDGVSIPLPVLAVDLHVAPDFSGRVVLYIENGKVKCDRRLLDDEHICALDTFIEMAREAGLRIQELTGGTDSNSNT